MNPHNPLINPKSNKPERNTNSLNSAIGWGEEPLNPGLIKVVSGNQWVLIKAVRVYLIERMISWNKLWLMNNDSKELENIQEMLCIWSRCFRNSKIIKN
jgi:hypothetical protein